MDVETTPTDVETKPTDQQLVEELLQRLDEVTEEEIARDAEGLLVRSSLCSVRTATKDARPNA
jgi:hypothetical protein